MKSHLLDRKILIEQATESTNDFGEPIKTWTAYAHPWAQVRYSTGNESYNDGVEIDSQTVRFNIRYRPGITTKMRVNFEGVIYDIESVEEPLRRQKLVLTCISRQ